MKSLARTSCEGVHNARPRRFSCNSVVASVGKPIKTLFAQNLTKAEGKSKPIECNIICVNRKYHILPLPVPILKLGDIIQVLSCCIADALS